MLTEWQGKIKNLAIAFKNDFISVDVTESDKFFMLK